MKTKYFLVSNGDFTCEGSSDNIKDIIKKYHYELNYRLKNYGSYNYNDFSIYRLSYNPKKIDIDYGMDGYIYFMDIENEDFIEYDDFDKHGIKQKEIKKDFLFYKN